MYAAIQRAVLRINDCGDAPIRKRITKSHKPHESFRHFWSLVLDDTHNNAVTIGWDNDLEGSFAVNNLHFGVDA